MPRPIDPNSGFTMTSPSARNAAIASSGCSHTTVSGTGSPACASSAVVHSLSTVRSIVRGELITAIPRSSSACSASRSEEHTSELQSLAYLVCRLLLEKKKNKQKNQTKQRKKKTK